MGKIGRFKLGKRLIRVSKLIFRKTRLRLGHGYDRLKPAAHSSESKPVSKLMKWLTNGVKSLCSTKPMPGLNLIKEKEVAVPKGHLAVYVGGRDGDFHRVLVPVVYFNHPLFSELLREAEEEYGYHQPGGITIPCGYSEFEQVQTRIKSGSGGRKLSWKACWSGR